VSRHERPTIEPLPITGLFRFNIFVPAIMSVGLLFWVVTLTRDLFRWRGRRELERRTRLAGAGVAAFVERPGTVVAVRAGLRRRRSYLLTGLVLFGVAGYVLVGAALNYLRPGGYVAERAWLVSLAVLLAGAFGFVGGVASVVFLFWSRPPRPLVGVLVATPLTRTPRGPDDDPDDEPGWGLSVAALLTPLAAVVWALVVATTPQRLRSVDLASMRRVAGERFFEVAAWLDPVHQPIAGAVLLVVIGLAAWRCRPLAGSLVLFGVVGVAASAVLRLAVDRPGPGETAAVSFPSGSTAVSVLVAAVLPLSIGVLTRRTSVIGLVRVPVAVVAVLIALAQVAQRVAWTTDVVGGALVGLAMAFGVEWSVAHRGWHAGCRGCPWSPHDHRPRLLSHIDLGDRRRVVRVLAHASTLVAVVGLSVLTLSGTMPENTEGSLLGEHIQRPVQLGLVGLVSLGALISWRFEAVGATLVAVAGTGLGVFAGLEYRPELAVLVTVALLVPAFLLWLSWQHRRRHLEIAVVAVVAASLVAGTWVGAGRVFDHYFGPTHPDSARPELEMDRVRWMWTGGLEADTVTVVAGIAAGGESVRIRLSPSVGAPVWSPPIAVPTIGIVRHRFDGLRPGTEHRVEVEVDGRIDATRGRGRVRTPEVGPMSFTVAVGACARVGSNGAVFDEIARLDPLLFLATGDLHYGNLADTDPASFRTAWERLLTRPGPASLFARTPVAYVWDDHDYGPNDADAASPSRATARIAYRQVVPHYPLVAPGDAPIQQAFTIGRVRFVLSDLRSERTAEHMTSPAQQAWLIDELTRASATHAAVVWVSAVPWIGRPVAGSDSWAGYPDDRRAIADALDAAGVENLVMVAGDAHMVAIDDGTNTGYASGGGPGFPLLHAAALDRPGGVKGGPYSEGTFPGGGQFGTVRVVDDGGDRLVVELAGRTWDGRTLVSHRVVLAVPPGA